VLVVTAGAIGSPAAGARGFVTSACGGNGGSAGKLQRIRGLDGGEAYQISCRSIGHASTPALEIICLVKANALDGFVAVTARRFPLRSLDALAIRQSRLIPAGGIQST
jgi:hypothetical protein